MDDSSFNYIEKELFLNNLFFSLINMDETKNWKTVTVDEDGEPVLIYDAHHDETVNIRTGEVIQGH